MVPALPITPGRYSVAGPKLYRVYGKASARMQINKMHGKSNDLTTPARDARRLQLYRNLGGIAFRIVCASTSIIPRRMNSSG
jgi:hypothetical protein